MDNPQKKLEQALAAAMSGEWDKAHVIVQEMSGPVACWIHAVLHKIEPDEGNSRYWYARARRNYEDFADPDAELRAITELLDTGKSSSG